MVRKLLLVASLVLSFLLVGCGGDDNRVCVREHQEQYQTTTFIKVGNVMVPLTSFHTRTVCDEYVTVVPEGT